MNFALHPQLAADTTPVMELALCRVLLMNNAAFPWMILVPARAGLREVFDLSADEYTQMMGEMHRVAVALKGVTRADKMNIAALGNVVPQLHIHVIARFVGDGAWPQPVWNSGVVPKPYSEAKKLRFIADFQGAMQGA